LEHREACGEDSIKTAVERIDCEDGRMMQLTRDRVASLVLMKLIYS
jgi:hypothetical protein